MFCVVNNSGSKFDAENRLLQGLVESSKLGSANWRASRRRRRRHLSREGIRQERQEQTGAREGYRRRQGRRPRCRRMGPRHALMFEGIHLIERINARGALIKVLDKPYLDLTTSLGLGFTAFLSAMAEDERHRIVKRANDGHRLPRPRACGSGASPSSPPISK